jgi:alcohol oxidase
MYPMSLGSVHISSADDPWANPDFNDNFLSCEEDVVLLVWSYKRMREIARRMPSYRGEVTIFHPQFPEGSEGKTSDNAVPVPIDAPNIKWTKEDDQVIEKYIRDTVATTWHSVSSSH